MYRFFEILPGLLSWITIILIFLFSWILPFYAAIFIILFDIYWLFKTIYLSLHLRATFLKMRESMKIDWLQELRQSANSKAQSDSRFAISDWQSIYHLIILPMYKEPYEVVKETFESLAKANYPKDKFIAVLAAEEKGGSADQETAKKIGKEFSNQFFKFLITTHPTNLPDEIPGKGSNETWATKETKRLIIDPLVLGSTEKISTASIAEEGLKISERVENLPGTREQSELGGKFSSGASLNFDHRRRTSEENFSIPLSYDNILVSVFDIDTQVPPDYFSRLSYVFLTSPHPRRSSFQPIPLFTNNIFQAPALARVISFSATFWHMMQQSRPERLTTFSSHSMPFKALIEIGFWNKNIVSEDSQIFWQLYLHYNGNWRVEPLFYPVRMDANVMPSFWQTMVNLYKQQRRWAWGCENIPYMLSGFLKNKKIPFRKKLYWGFNIIEGFHSWATNALLIFALGWLPVLIGGQAFNATLLSYNLPLITRWIMTLAMVGIASSAILSIILLPPKPHWFKPWHYLLYFLQWALMPLTLIIFGAIPALEAQTRLMLGGRYRLGFWVTPKHR